MNVYDLYLFISSVCFSIMQAVFMEFFLDKATCIGLFTLKIGHFRLKPLGIVGLAPFELQDYGDAQFRRCIPEAELVFGPLLFRRLSEVLLSASWHHWSCLASSYIVGEQQDTLLFCC